jgi:hypothetical protein
MKNIKISIRCEEISNFALRGIEVEYPIDEDTDRRLDEVQATVADAVLALKRTYQQSELDLG